jgi:hypothetical protein
MLRVNIDSACHTGRDDGNFSYLIATIIVLAISSLASDVSFAYTAAGDRTFPATLLLPQVAPSDATWGTFSTQLENAAKIGDTIQDSSFTGTFSKTITDRFGIQLEDGVSLLDRLHASPVNGFQNLSLQIQYEMVLDQPHEFVLSVEVDRKFGGTGDERINPAELSTTEPSITFAKGLNDLPFPFARPLAITGFAGYQIADGGQPNRVNVGISLQYSFPYLVSKVKRTDLPGYLRGMTPIVELSYSAPAGPGSNQPQTLLIGPGMSYSQSSGWELGIEAMIPTNRATGRGVGVIAQVVVQLDYLLAGTFLGRPIFAAN